MKRFCVSMLLTAALLVPSVAAQEITVASAADLQFAFQDVAARFEKETGKHVKLIFGSSGNFFTQIQNGAQDRAVSYEHWQGPANCALSLQRLSSFGEIGRLTRK